MHRYGQLVGQFNEESIKEYASNFMYGRGGSIYELKQDLLIEAKDCEAITFGGREQTEEGKLLNKYAERRIEEEIMREMEEERRQREVEEAKKSKGSKDKKKRKKRKKSAKDEL